MSQIPESVIEEILSKADIESVVGKYVSFTKRTGSNLFGLCPFHSEKTPSFSVSLNKGIYHCFGCGKGGNAINFIKDVEHLSYPEAIRFLGNQYGIDIPDTYDSKANAAIKGQKERVRALLNDTGIFYYQCLSSKEAANCRAYIKKRALEANTVKQFGLGYAPEGWDTLYRYLLSKGYTDEEMRNSGLFTVSKKTGKLIDLFRGRLMFPIFDFMGKLIAFGGRTLTDELPKYVNSPDSLVYKKQDHLYAFNYAKKSKTNQLIIVEGYMDVIAMHQAGVTNAVASLGTAFTESQLRLASKSNIDEIVFFFDADKAGKNAAIRAIKMMLKYLKKMTGLKIRIKIACVPDKKDPDEYIRNNGAEKFAEVVRMALDVDDYLANRAYDDNFSDDKGLDTHAYQEDIITYGSWIYDDIKREKMAASAAIYLGVNYQTVLNRMNDAQVKFEKEQAQMDERMLSRENEANINERKNSYVEDSNDSSNSNAVVETEADKTSEVAYRQEIELLIYASRLKGNLCDPKVIKQEDVLRPGDFYGKNMQNVVAFFLNNFEANYGVSDAMLINELSKYVFNGMPAEEAYLKICDETPEIRNVDVLRDTYLSTLYRLRIGFLYRYQKKLISMLDSANADDKNKINAKLKNVVSMRMKLEEKVQNL